MSEITPKTTCRSLQIKTTRVLIAYNLPHERVHSISYACRSPQLCADKQQQLRAAERQNRAGGNEITNEIKEETVSPNGFFGIILIIITRLTTPDWSSSVSAELREHRPPLRAALTVFPAQSQTASSCSPAASILAPCPVGASRVLDCLPHMTRVFVPVISASISVNQCRLNISVSHPPEP